jgi:1,4-alpha-glucan branching enzyme
MGCEFAQGTEWNSEATLDWYVLDYPLHKGMQTLVKDLNKLYRSQSPLYKYDFDGLGFEWIECNDDSQSVLSYLRKDDSTSILTVLNFTPVPREYYRVGVPEPGRYKVILNSDSTFYGGSNYAGEFILDAQDIEWSGRPYSIELTLPPLAGLVLEKEK